MTSRQAPSLQASIGNALSHYYPNLPAAVGLHHSGSAKPAASWFSPSREVPDLTGSMRRFYEASQMRVFNLPAYKGHELRVLDLMRHADTRTTKTFPSLMIVARAVEHIQRTGERIMIITATSGNKGTALRDAVLRALQEGLASPSDLSITVLAPSGSLSKLWSSPLSADPAMRRRNPTLLHYGSAPEDVKRLARQFVLTRSEQFANRSKVRLWYTLDLANYIVADTLRAYFEAESFPPVPGERRVHAHAVSSAFGLLGYHLGRRVLTEVRQCDLGEHPQFLLVQHLRTPDMVLSLQHGSFDHANMPVFARRAADGRYVQATDPNFPQVTDNPSEELDATFYTRQPTTSTEINNIISRHGGGGIVVSRHECCIRYPHIRQLMKPLDIRLPEDPRHLREWSLVMAMSGVMNAIDRGLLPEDASIVIHASGSYSDEDFEPIPQHLTVPVRSLDDMLLPIENAAHC